MFKEFVKARKPEFDQSLYEDTLRQMFNQTFRVSSPRLTINSFEETKKNQLAKNDSELDSVHIEINEHKI